MREAAALWLFDRLETRLILNLIDQKVSLFLSLMSQADDMREAAALANEAGELLWEMVAENEHGDGAAELREKAQQLQVRRHPSVPSQRASLTTSGTQAPKRPFSGRLLNSFRYAGTRAFRLREQVTTVAAQGLVPSFCAAFQRGLCIALWSMVAESMRQGKCGGWKASSIVAAALRYISGSRQLLNMSRPTLAF